MKRVSVWILTSLFVAAWFLPVVSEPYHSPEPTWLPGLDAFLIALGLNESTGSALSITSALTNVVMVAAIVWLARSPHDHVPSWKGWLLAAAALLNLSWAWWPVGPEERIALSTGYWLWVGAFLLASVLLFREARRPLDQPAV